MKVIRAIDSAFLPTASRRVLPFALLGILIIAVIAATPTPPPGASPAADGPPLAGEDTDPVTCNVSRGRTGYWYGGFGNSNPSFSGDTFAIKGDLWNYNPDPVFNDVSFWVLLSTNTGDKYAQVGWGKGSGDSVEYVFAEFDDTSTNTHTRYYYHSDTNSWTQKKGASPTQSETYKVTWVRLSGTHQIQVAYGNSSILTHAVDWEPGNYEIMGEVHNYQSGQGVNKGEHSPGHGGTPGNRIHAENLQVYGVNGLGWQDVSPTRTREQGNMSIDQTGVSGVGFRIWDNRCTE